MDDINTERNTGFTLIGQQFVGLLTKKMLYSVRNPMLSFSQILIPCFFAILMLLIIKSWPKMGDQRPSLVLNVDPFKGTDIPYFIKNKNEPKVKQMANHYKSQFSGQNRVYEHYSNTTDLTQSMIEYILKESEKDISYFNFHVPIGAMISDKPQGKDLALTALFNNQPFHAISASLAAVDLAAIRYLTNKPNYLMEVSNHPLPRTTADNLEIAKLSKIRFQLSWNLLYSMSFLAASFSVFLVKESSVKLKHLQKVSGVKLYLYWLTAFLWDYYIFIITCLLVLITYYLLGQEPIQSTEILDSLLVMFVIYGLALLPSVYLLSFMFEDPSNAYVWIFLLNIVSGIGTFMVVSILELPLLELEYIADILDLIFAVLVTNYGMGRSLYLLYNNYLGNKYCNREVIQKTCNIDTIDAKEFFQMMINEFKEMADVIPYDESTLQLLNGTRVSLPDAIKPCCKSESIFRLSSN